MLISSENFEKDLQRLRATALEALAKIADLRILEQWRADYLGRGDGQLTQILRSISGIPNSERPRAGGLANELKLLLEKSYSDQHEFLKRQEANNPTKRVELDVTLPGRPLVLGGFHPTTKVLREICDAFTPMGFQIAEGPEVEWDTFNFELLNIPTDHPARDMFNTFWVDGKQGDGWDGMLLRTHTSPMQARVMRDTSPPIRVLVPGRCFRYESTDATHEWHFFQVEGLAVDEGITFANLKGTLYEFARRMFGAERKIRFRCDYFPFVEPGVDVSIDCFNCSGGGCRICKDTGWIEIMGAGMVHPKVLEMANYDPVRYTGFAFGMGIERIAMLKYGIEDVRLFYGNDFRFLRQF